MRSTSLRRFVRRLLLSSDARHRVGEGVFCHGLVCDLQITHLYNSCEILSVQDEIVILFLEVHGAIEEVFVSRVPTSVVRKCGSSRQRSVFAHLPTKTRVLSDMT